MGTAFQRRSVLGIADQPELPPYSSPGPSIAMAAKPQGRRPGLFGRLGNALSRVDWERVAAAMRDDPSHMQMLMNQRENMAERARQEAEAEAERRAGKQQNSELEAMIANEPPEVQAFARLAPQEYIRRRLGATDGWESGHGYSHTFRVNPDGTVTLGDPLPLRPRAAVQGYVMPNDVDEWEYND